MNQTFYGKSEARPKIMVSQCLTGDVCRWDGKTVLLPFLAVASTWINFVPVCPEMGIGLGCPRPVIRLVRSRTDKTAAVGKPEPAQDPRPSGGIDLVQPQTGRNLTVLMRNWSNQTLRQESPDGFLLKYKSPSCGLTNVRVYAKQKGRQILSFNSGLFAAQVRLLYPRTPAIDDFRLATQPLYYHWLASIFAIRRFRDLFEERLTGSVLDSPQETQRRMRFFDDFYRPLLTSLCPILSKRLDSLIDQSDILQYFDVLLSILGAPCRAADFTPYFPQELA